jgi:hypothetical protein
MKVCKNVDIYGAAADFRFTTNLIVYFVSKLRRAVYAAGKSRTCDKDVPVQKGSTKQTNY